MKIATATTTTSATENLENSHCKNCESLREELFEVKGTLKDKIEILEIKNQQISNELNKITLREEEFKKGKLEVSKIEFEFKEKNEEQKKKISSLQKYVESLKEQIHQKKNEKLIEIESQKQKIEKLNKENSKKDEKLQFFKSESEEKTRQFVLLKEKIKILKENQSQIEIEKLKKEIEEKETKIKKILVQKNFLFDEHRFMHEKYTKIESEKKKNLNIQVFQTLVASFTSGLLVFILCFFQAQLKIFSQFI